MFGSFFSFFCAVVVRSRGWNLYEYFFNFSKFFSLLLATHFVPLAGCRVLAANQMAKTKIWIFKCLHKRLEFVMVRKKENLWTLAIKESTTFGCRFIKIEHNLQQKWKCSRPTEEKKPIEKDVREIISMILVLCDILCLQ